MCIELAFGFVQIIFQVHLKGLGYKLQSLFFGKGESLTYDNINHESKSLFVANDYIIGGRSEITKQIGSLQLSSSLMINKGSFFQFSSKFSTDDFMVLATVDQDGSWQSRLCGRSFGFIAKAQTLCSRRNVFSQIELNKSLGNTDFGAKIVSPAIPNIKPIYVFNFLSKLGKGYIGLEAILSSGRTLEVGLNMQARRESPKSVTVFGLQQLTTVSITHFRRFGPFFSGTLDFNYSVMSKECLMAAAWKLETKDSTVRTQLDTSGKIVSVIENRLGDNLLMAISSEIDLLKNTGNFGVSFCLFS